MIHLLLVKICLEHEYIYSIMVTTRFATGRVKFIQKQCKKGLSIFLSQAGMYFTNQTLFPARESLVSDIPAGDGKTSNLFYSVGCGPGEVSGRRGQQGKQAVEEGIYKCTLEISGRGRVWANRTAD